MNDLKFLEIMGKIDDDLIREADVDSAAGKKSKPIISKNVVYAIGSVAAAAVITVSSVAFYNYHKPSDLLVDHSAIQQDNPSQNDSNPDNQGIPVTTNGDNVAEHSTSSTADTVQTDEKQPSTNETVSTEIQDTNTIVLENDTSKTDTQTQSPSDNTTPETQPTQQPKITTQEQSHTQPSEEIVSADYYYQNFSATVDPDSDAYGEDELHLVSIVISGRYYYQLDTSEHPAHNIPSTVSDSDFGEYVGNITELQEYDDPANYTVSSKEPNLSGADVYYYAPADSSAVIIVKRGQQCSIFVFNGMANVSDNNSVFAETFKLYGASSAEDIENISFSVATPNGSVMEIKSQGVITDRDRINSIVDILYQLTPESETDSLSATPQWLIDAWNDYRANPDAYTREDIAFDITFKNGTVLKDISYQPYLGNGYVSGMQELTPEQNATLRALIQ